MGELVGLDAVRKMGADVGLGPDLPASPTIYLGTFPTTLRKLTEAYTLFPNDGVRKPGYFIERIDDDTGATIYRAPHGTSQVLQPGTTWMTHVVAGKSAAKRHGRRRGQAGLQQAPAAG